MTVKPIRPSARRQHIRLFVAGIAALVLWDPGSGRSNAQAVSNPITVENARAGTIDDWDITGVSDPTIQGFATDISVNFTVQETTTDDRQTPIVKDVTLGFRR
jgi:hypothetical protein